MMFCQWAILVLIGLAMVLRFVAMGYHTKANDSSKVGDDVIGLVRDCFTGLLIWGAGGFSLIFGS